METNPEHSQLTAEQAYEQQYQELSRVMSRVFNKIITHHASGSEKTWAHVGDLEHITEIMNGVDEFLGH